MTIALAFSRAGLKSSQLNVDFPVLLGAAKNKNNPESGGSPDEIDIIFWAIRI